MTVDDLAPWRVLLARFGADIGLDGLGFTEAGYCSLTFDKGRVVHLEVQAGGLLMMTVLGDAPTGTSRLQVLEKLLAANAFWVGSQGATLSPDPDLRQVLPMRREPLDVVRQWGLTALLGELIDTGEQWAARLGQGQHRRQRLRL